MIKIHEMTKERIYFESDKVLYRPMVEVWLPAMPSFPEGYKINIYGILKKTVEGMLYLEGLYTTDPTDLTIYHAFVDYLEQEKTNSESIASLHSALVAMVESHTVLCDKIKGLHETVEDTKDMLMLSKLKKSGNTTIH